MLIHGTDLLHRCALLHFGIDADLLDAIRPYIGPSLPQTTPTRLQPGDEVGHEMQAHWTFSIINSTTCQRAYRSGGMRMSCGRQHIMTWSLSPQPRWSVATIPLEAGELVHWPLMLSWTISACQRTLRGYAEP